METQSCYPTEANGVLAYQWDAGHWVSHSVEGLHSIKDSFMRVTFLESRFLKNHPIAKWKIPLRNFLSSETWLSFSSRQGLILSFRIEVFYMDTFSLFFGNMVLKSGPLTLTNSCKGKAYFERISKEELGRIIRTNNWTFTLESTEGNAGQLSLPPPIVIDYASKFQSASRIVNAEDEFWSLSYATHLKVSCIQPNLCGHQTRKCHSCINDDFFWIQIKFVSYFLFSNLCKYSPFRRMLFAIYFRWNETHIYQLYSVTLFNP
eukprot:TRINITY_DN3399_c0_g1_i4.p1 TRINITY_DN3399_c0_g1~~TRINITY_DN3399_c0_g1_i4.p1  ORF type:complete len:304 (-),score=34.74 TRINITY_DN3399_c0_g1_i4:755-1540(-)